MNPKFLEFKTRDGLELPGLLYEAQKKGKVAIYLHGNGSTSVFYHKKENEIMAQELARNNISIFFFNNRGANIIKRLNKKLYGMAFERIKECIPDIDGAVKFLTKLGYKTFYLIGSSTGANKICVYNYYRPKNKISKYVLLSGGDDVGIYYQELGKKKFWNFFKQAKKKIKQGKGGELIKELIPFELVFSWMGFHDIANPDGDYNVFPYLEVVRKLKLSTKQLFRHFKSINKPTQVVYGELDEYVYGDAVRVVKALQNIKPEFDYQIIKGADHGFSAHARQLSRMVSNWLKN